MKTATKQEALAAFGNYHEKSNDLPIGQPSFQGAGMGLADSNTPDNTTHLKTSLEPPWSVSKHGWQDMLHIKEYFDQYDWEYFDTFDNLYKAHTETDLVRDDITELQNKAEKVERLNRLADIIDEIDSVDQQFMKIGLFDWHSHPKTYRLMKTIELISGHVVLQYKDRYKRKRPTFDHPILDSIIDVPSHPSWPSGHATQSHAMATMLTLVIKPHHEGRKTKFEETAAQIAENREWAGVHYRSDSDAGALLSNMLMFDIGEKFKHGIDSRLNSLIKHAIAEWE